MTTPITKENEMASKTETQGMVIVEQEENGGWVVDIVDYEALGLYDTSSRWFQREQDARAFAEEVAALLIIPMAD
jgi:hypothetical protein